MISKKEIVGSIVKELLFEYDRSGWFKELYLEALKEVSNTIEIADDKKVEPFTICNLEGAPGSATLETNAPRNRSLIMAYSVPTGYYFVLDPDSFEMEVSLKSEVKGKTPKPLEGDVDVVLETATGGKSMRALHSMSSFINDAATPLLEEYVVLRPGDLIKVYFVSNGKISIEDSFLSLRLKISRRGGIRLSCQQCALDKLLRQNEQLVRVANTRK